MQPKSITPKYLDAKSKGFSKLNKSKENISWKPTKEKPEKDKGFKNKEFNDCITFYCTQNANLKKDWDEEDNSHTWYSNLDTEFLKMHEPSGDNEDSEVLLMSPKTNEKDDF